MFRRWIHSLLESLRRVVAQPADELTRWQKTVRFAYDLGRYGARQLARDQAPQMAAALSYRTLFGLIPLLVVGSILVKAFGGFSQFQANVEEFLVSLGGAGAATPGAAEGVAPSVRQWILDLLTKVESINLAAIGWIGVGVLAYSVIGLTTTIEGCFNGICHAPEGRSWARRIPIYWTVVTVAPAALALTAYLDHKFDEFITTAVSWRVLIAIAPIAWSVFATWLVIFVTYKLLPNTSVQTRPAMIGAFVAALLIEVGKRFLGVYVENAVSVNLLYGSLGLIPIFMLWVYVMWLAVLFGLEVCATLQQLVGRSLEDMQPRGAATGFVDPVSILPVMEVVARRFAASRPSRVHEIAEETGLPEATVRSMLDRLVERGYLHRIEGDDQTVVLARPPDGVAAADLIEIGFSLVADGGLGRETPFLGRLRAAQRHLAERVMLTELLPQPQVAGAGDQGSPPP